MCKRIISLITLIALILSLSSCSFLESVIPGLGNKPDNIPDSGDNIEEKPDGGNTDTKPEENNPDGGNTDINPDGGNVEEKPDEGGDSTDGKYCEGGCKDADGDAVCDNCGNGMIVPPEQIAPTVFLVGDSTVKTYEDNQYIAGWGQFLSYFLGDDIVVKNAAHGGRSSRSFINEGRLYDIDGNNYSFSQNGGNSIGDEIKAGDYLFIQFGHNDDASKLSNYTTIYDRMVPLGEPDANGIYPTTPAEKMPTTYLPTAYTDKASDSEEATALSTIAKYGSEYYAYGSGTFKWYLKQYIDFAREKGAIPVLVTPVARVKFNSGGEIIGGAGLHGDNFAYVQAVRQLAEEENCLLIDLFAESKEMLETVTPAYANYLMALKPNELTGVWPLDYDNTYGKTELGYTGIEATHYNKYGAFLQAAAVAEVILANPDGYSFSHCVKTTPERYVDPSNLIGRNTVAAVESLFTSVTVTNPSRDYYDPQTVVDKINAIPTEITSDNYLEVKKMCEVARDCYAKVNVDDRELVTNMSVLEAAELIVKAFEIASRPDPVKTVIFNADNLSRESYTETVSEGDFTLVATSDKTMGVNSKKAAYTYNGTTYEHTHGLSVGGKATFGSNRYISFTAEGPCSVTIAVQSSGSSVRTLAMVNSSGASVGSFEAGTSVTVTTVELTEGGTYYVGSAGSGMYIFSIIIEYFE